MWSSLRGDDRFEDNHQSPEGERPCRAVQFERKRLQTDVSR